MTQTRTLFAELQSGSRLYGSATDTSDNDLVRIWFPTQAEVVSNRQVTIAQTISNDTDVRNIVLGEFVMGLGKNNENTLLAIHYRKEIGIDPERFVNKAFVLELFKTGSNMQKFAKTAKIYAHGYRYRAIAIRLAQGQFTKYPLLDHDLSIYKRLRAMTDEEAVENASKFRIDESVTINDSTHLSNQKIDTQYLAEWVWNQYAGLYGGVEW